MNYVLVFENQKITLYANKKTTPSRDGYMITQIKRSFSLFATISFLQFASEFIEQSKYFFWEIQNNFIFFSGSVHKNYLGTFSKYYKISQLIHT